MLTLKTPVQPTPKLVGSGQGYAHKAEMIPSHKSQISRPSYKDGELV
jgi:hypothetical protein